MREFSNSDPSCSEFYWLPWLCTGEVLGQWGLFFINMAEPYVIHIVPSTRVFFCDSKYITNGRN